MRPIFKAGIVLVLILAALYVAASFTTPGFNRPPAPAPTPSAPIAKYTLTIDGATFHVDLATTPAEQEQGLGGRASLAPDSGMLFEFDIPASYPFWMKDMQFPLDFIWIDATGHIAGVTENVDPQIGASDSELKLYTPPVPVTKILEVNAGTVKLIGAKVGDPVEPLASH